MSIRFAQVLCWVGTAVVLCVATDVRCQDVFTGFEIDRPEPPIGQDFETESYIFGNSPKSVTFNNGVVISKNLAANGEFLIRTGKRSWLVGCAKSGDIVFETPAEQISFYLYEAGSTESQVLMMTENFRILRVYSGQPQVWVHVEYDGPPVKRVQVGNHGIKGSSFPCAGGVGGFPFLGVDDFSFTAFEEQTLEVVDVFYFPLIGDGAAGATQLQTSLFLTSTEADVTLGVEWRDRSGNPVELAACRTFEVTPNGHH